MAVISFIMPAYKSQYLSAAIESILAQDCGNWELVIVDDCSPEDLKSIVDRYNDDRIRYYRNEKNLGAEIWSTNGIIPSLWLLVIGLPWLPTMISMHLHSVPSARSLWKSIHRLI